MNEGTALLQFKLTPKPSKLLSEDEALSQFITIPDSEKCGKCGRKIFNPSGDTFADAPYGKPQIEICESCFDGSIKASQGFY